MSIQPSHTHSKQSYSNQYATGHLARQAFQQGNTADIPALSFWELYRQASNAPHALCSSPLHWNLEPPMGPRWRDCVAEGPSLSRSVTCHCSRTSGSSTRPCFFFPKRMDNLGAGSLPPGVQVLTWCLVLSISMSLEPCHRFDASLSMKRALKTCVR
jgi:hypothetical protein